MPCNVFVNGVPQRGTVRFQRRVADAALSIEEIQIEDDKPAPEEKKPAEEKKS